ncbi:hypothetical protein BDV12DRAFT_12788 [Aspergillus spectabilis]
MNSWLALALATFLTSAAAEECHRNFTINPNDNTTELFESCDTIVGNINIGHGFNGSVELRNVFNITGTIEFRAGYDHDHDSRPIVHFFNAPDLYYLGNLDVYDFSVYELYMRNLETAGDISVYVDEYALNLDLNSLVEADSINISRALSTINLTNLKTVHGAATIDYHRANSSSEEPFSNINNGRIDFPSLETAGSLNLAGATKNITLPQLISVGPPRETGFESGLNIHMEDMKEPFELDLRRLRSVEDQLYLSGNLKKLRTLQLTNFTSINITSSTNFDCDSFVSDIERSTEYPEDGSSVTCTNTPSKGLSKGAKIAIGVVVPVVVIAIVVGIALMWTRKKSRRQSRARMELRGLQSDTAIEREDRAASPPPPYSSHGR